MSMMLEGLSLRLSGRSLVDSVSLSVGRGETVALVGASGSGKSLTAAALTGSLPLQADVGGHLTVGDRPVPLRGRRRPGIAAVRQDSLTALHPLVRIDRQLVPAILRSGMAATRSGASSTAATLLEEVGLADPRRVLRSYPMELSGGQRQRVCIVQALACRASFLVADEPTTALDVVSQQLVLAALATAAAAGTGILFITHDVAAASALCSRAIVLERGTVVDGGSFEYLARESTHPYVRTLMRSVHGTGRAAPTAA